MHAFDLLLEVATKLNGPGGCPWDVKQTFTSLQPYVLEEAHEVLEAVDSGDSQKILEELGDLLYTVIFFAKVAEREGRFTLADILNSVREKLIHRHPHVFGENKLSTSEEVMQQWEKNKLKEKSHEDRKSALDGIPETLPLLMRAQKIVGKILRKTPTFFSASTTETDSAEDQLGEELIALILRAQQKEIDLESVLRRKTASCEKRFREYEQTV